MKVLNPTDIGDQNKLSILQIIKENDGISRQEISKRLKLSAPAVSKNIAALLGGRNRCNQRGAQAYSAKI